MLKKYFALIITTIALFTIGHAQTGSGGIKGKVLDQETGEALPFVNVVVEQKGRIVTGASTDFDGKFFIKPLAAGTYDIKVKFVGYAPLQKSGVIVNSDKITFADMSMKSSAVEMDVYEVVSYKVPLISKDNTSSGSTIGGEDMDKMATRSVAGIAEQVGGVVSADDGNSSLNFRGARSDANYYFIDGIKVRASANSLPQAAIEQVSVTTGGIPAQYGDVTGGVISITTKGAASSYGGSVEYVTSGFRNRETQKVIGLDPYAYNLVEFSAYGPILWKKDSAKKKESPILGFFLSGNFNYVADPRPSHVGYWKAKDGVRDELIDDPLRYNPSGDGTTHNGEFLRMNEIENVRTKPNAQQYNSSIQGKFDINTSKNTNLTIGGNLTYNNNKGVGNNSFYGDGTGSGSLYPKALMNWDNNPRRVSYDSRGFVRFTQRFNDGSSSDENSSVIKNAFYTVQFDYSNSSRRTFNEKHKDDIWRYGYVGEFQSFENKTYRLETDSAFQRQGWIHQTWEDTLVGFTPSDDNVALANYTSRYYDLFGWQGYDGEGNPVFDPTLAADPNDPTRTNKFLSDRTTMQTNGALFNGDSPREILGIWESPADQYNGNARLNQNQYRLSASGSADIGDHNILIGFEYEQRIDRQYNVSPAASPGGTNGLWALGRLYTNSHIEQKDVLNPVIDFIPGFEGAPSYTYPRLNSAPGEYTAQDAQSFFDYNLRKENPDLAPLGADGNDYIDFDNINPDQLSIDYFAADELLNNGNGVVSYFGYDVYGNKTADNPTIDDFFQAEDQFGNKTRRIGAFRPIYIAGYIQDKFAFDDLVFNVGLRVDRYDANQKVLSDPFVFFPTVKAGEDQALELADGAHPENIGEDFVVYVDDINQPTSIQGYRDGSTWYNKEGVEIANPDALATSSGIAPLLVDPERTRSGEINSDAFEDYAPQTNFMPRIAFSFPISDEALFFAHYDILTKRPTTGDRLNPTDYLFLESTNGQSVRNNPNLQAEKTIDYEAGFQQKLTNSSSIKISTFYREFRDQVQVIRVKQAFPREYTTYGNVDFGTVKGLTFAYDLRRTGNISVRGSYSIQFAEGTGSSATTAAALVNAGFDNLKVTSPLNFDQRHTIQAVIDYRYADGKDYNGPIIAGKQILANTGANLTMLTNSGRPFNGQSESTGNAFTTNVGNAFLDGTINGNNVPWSFKVDARIDKDFQIKVGKDKAKSLDMTVYLQILNVLNNQNILNVYRFTADPLDDGYLADARWQGDIAAQNDTQSFQELYRIKNAVGSNFNLPRRFRLGLRVAF